MYKKSKKLMIMAVVSLAVMLAAVAVLATATESDAIPYVDKDGNTADTTTLFPAVTPIPVPASNNGVNYLTDVGAHGGWYYLQAGTTGTNNLIINGDVKIILTDGSILNASGGNPGGHPGIEVSGANTLTIYGGPAGTGTLNATTGNGTNAAGIGGSQDNPNAGTIIICGGKITSTGSNTGAGIGGGNNGSGGTIIIYGGTVSAETEVSATGNGGAGIGGGDGGSAGNITINGGTVSATSNKGAAIGGGDGGDGGTITINGGTITTKKTDGSTGGTNGGIGAGSGGTGGTIVITGGSQDDTSSPPATNTTTVPPVNSAGERIYRVTATLTGGGPQTIIDGFVLIDGVPYELHFFDGIKTKASGSNSTFKFYLPCYPGKEVVVVIMTSVGTYTGTVNSAMATPQMQPNDNNTVTLVNNMFTVYGHVYLYDPPNNELLRNTKVIYTVNGGADMEVFSGIYGKSEGMYRIIAPLGSQVVIKDVVKGNSTIEFPPSSYAPPSTPFTSPPSTSYIHGGNFYLTILPTATTTTLTSSPPSPSVYGQAVTFTVTVTPTTLPGEYPTGWVHLKYRSDDSDVCAPYRMTAAASDNGTHDFIISNLSVGSHDVYAWYGGTLDLITYSGSDSKGATPLIHVVNQASTTTAIASDHNFSLFGQPVTFTVFVAPVAPGAGAPTGTVELWADGTSLGTVTLVAADNGVAYFTKPDFAAGTYNMTAGYNGDVNFLASFTVAGSTDLDQIVNKADTNSSISPNVNPAIFGNNVIFTATVAAVAPGAGTPTGNVELWIDGILKETKPLAGGVAVFTAINNMTVGNHNITVQYLGDANFNTSSASIVEVVNPGAVGPTGYFITASSDANSTIAPSGTINVPKGANQTYVFSAAQDYKVFSVTINGVALSGDQIKLGSYTFFDVNANHTIVVTSALKGPDDRDDDDDGNGGGGGGGGGSGGGGGGSGGGDRLRIGGTEISTSTLLILLAVIIAVGLLFIIVLWRKKRNS